MVPKNVLCCFYPTTVLFIDDNSRFLSQLKSQIDPAHCAPRFFDNPRTAQQFLEQYKSEPFTQGCIAYPGEEGRDHRRIHVNITDIYKQIYNPKRFEEISVVVVDYAMPGMNGREFCQAVHKQQDLRIILLTGEADARHAVDMFNAGVIAGYIRKDEIEFKTTLNTMITDLQRAYFQELSDVVTHSLVKNPDLPTYCLADPVFKNFFQDFLTTHKVTEYYLLDQYGSFLFLNENGKVSWLIVKSEDAMESAASEVEGLSIPEDIREKIKKKQVITYDFAHPDLYFPQNVADWPKMVYPASPLNGKETYYYCYIEQPLVSDTIQMNQITPYIAYLEEHIHKT